MREFIHDSGEINCNIYECVMNYLEKESYLL